MANVEEAIFAMRNGGFGPFPKGPASGPESFLSSPPPETEAELIGLWVSGEAWSVTGYGVHFPQHAGLSEQEMMDMEISYTDSAITISRKMEFPALPPDPEASEAFKAMTPLLHPDPDGPSTPDVSDLLRGFSASLAEVIRAYAPRHAAAIGGGDGVFVSGPKLGPALGAFASLLLRTSRLNGDVPDLPAADGAGAFFIAPNRAIDLRTVFDRAAFRSLMMGETVPRALAVSLFEARHALDERLSAQRLPAQESWEALILSPQDYFLSGDRERVGLWATRTFERKRSDTSRPSEDFVRRDPTPLPPDFTHGPWGGPSMMDDNPASFGL